MNRWCNVMMDSLLILLYTFFNLCYLTRSNIYNNKSTILLTGQADTFYGFSVHLQRGNPARIIIGAPQTERKSGYFGGSVHDCDILSNQRPANCRQYEVPIATGYVGTNNLFGAAIDGGTNRNNNVAISMPKYMKEEGQYYAVGGIYKLFDIEQNLFYRFPKIDEDYISPRVSEYLFGFAEYGFSIHAINDTDFLYGAPGYSQWRGQVFHVFETEGAPVPEARRAPRKFSRSIIERDTKLVLRQPDDAALAGYAVTSGNFFESTSFVVGMPNDNNYCGSVKLYDNNLLQLTLTSETEQMGEHYGSALAVADINGDGYDDLLIGAPNYGEVSSTSGELVGFDNGRVYVYLSNKVAGFFSLKPLTGPITSRFGTSITNLGKFSTSQTDAIAIGSPYDEGVGAVYVYIWYNDELNLNSKIMLKDAKAFGYSISRGVDIDGNNVPDFAVGDYRKNTVTILKGKSIFKYNVRMNYPILKADEDEKGIEIDVCYLVEDIDTPIDTNVTLHFDNRFDFQRIQMQHILIDKQYCEKFSLKFRKAINKKTPLLITITLDSMICDDCPLVSPLYSNTFEERIPFQYCSSAICTPKLVITSQFNDKSVIVAQDTRIDVAVDIRNDGDSAFECLIFVETKPDMAISFGKKMKCTELPCKRDLIRSEEKIEYELTFKNYIISQDKLTVTTNVKCINVTTTEVRMLELRSETKFIVMPSESSLLYDSENRSTFLVNGEITYIFHNRGPSYLWEERFTINIPRYINEEQMIEIYEPITPENVIIQSTNGEIYDVVAQDDEVSNSSEVLPAGFTTTATDLPNTIKCEDEDVKCMTITGKVINLHKDGRVKLTFSVRIHILPILMNYKRSFSIASTLSHESNIYNAKINVVDRLTLSDSVWFYILIGVIVACILIALIVFGLKKLNFFSRPTRERLMEIQNELYGMELENPDQHLEAPTEKTSA